MTIPNVVFARSVSWFSWQFLRTPWTEWQFMWKKRLSNLFICTAMEVYKIEGFLTFFRISNFYFFLFLDNFFGGLQCIGHSLLMSPFCIFERCLDSNPESCRSYDILYAYSAEMQSSFVTNLLILKLFHGKYFHLGYHCCSSSNICELGEGDCRR